jgi:hypothetical protein
MNGIIICIDGEICLMIVIAKIICTYMTTILEGLLPLFQIDFHDDQGI